MKGKRMPRNNQSDKLKKHIISLERLAGQSAMGSAVANLQIDAMLKKGVIK